MDTFTKQHGEILLALGRKSIAERLGVQFSGYGQGDLQELLNDATLQRDHATFVTLKRNGQLRGCIGNLTPCGTVVEGVARNAVNSAFNDHRFSPLEVGEFDEIQIEISILSQPQLLEYDDWGDLVGKLRVGVDGVTISKDRASATFLPQVWEQLTVPDQFLTHLCRKASLSADAWKVVPLRVETYQVQHFSE